MKDYLILLYYCYTQIEDPESFSDEHHLYCVHNNLLGRIIIAGEGINGTISGKREDCVQYMRDLKSDKKFADIEFKVDEVEGHAFQKLYVRVKPEIVNLGLLHIHPKDKTGIHLDPKEFREMKDQDDVVVLDVRSNYEHEIGHFKNAITLDIENFREFPDKLKELESIKDRKILTYCTGGIKCEKASAFLLENGFENVYQLHGGIIKYGFEEGGKDFDGKCYVFDNRVAVDVNHVNPTTVSICHICGAQCDRMINCANPECNEHIPVCENCGWELGGACSEECQKHPKKREYDGTGYYKKELNGYNPYLGLKSKSKKTSNW